MKMLIKVGAANPAKVLSVEPDLIVSVLSTDFDDVIFLKFNSGLTAAQRLQIGERLVTVSGFVDDEEKELAADLLPGPRSSRMFTNFHPVVLQLVSEDVSAIRATMDALPDWEWKRLDELTEIMAPHRAKFPRNGNPYFSGEENNLVYPTLVKLKREKLRV